jgi:hypothetical protein
MHGTLTILYKIQFVERIKNNDQSARSLEIFLPLGL